MLTTTIIVVCKQLLSRLLHVQQICEALLDHCLAPDCRMGGLGCDNMTVIIACCLHDGEPYSELARKCSEQVERKQTDSERDAFSESPNCEISEERTGRSTYLQREKDTLPSFGTSKLKETLHEVNTDSVFSRQNVCISGHVQSTSSVDYDIDINWKHYIIFNTIFLHHWCVPKYNYCVSIGNAILIDVQMNYFLSCTLITHTAMHYTWIAIV